MKSTNKLLENLNNEQKEAVLSTEGPNLIIAGAGTGKTKVLTTRVAHIIDNNLAFPSQILCVTFTTPELANDSNGFSFNVLFSVGAFVNTRFDVLLVSNFAR